MSCLCKLIELYFKINYNINYTKFIILNAIGEIMNEKKIIIIVCFLIVIILVLNYFPEIYRGKTQTIIKKGYANARDLVSDHVGSHYRNTLAALNTILESEEYGIFVIEQKGEFTYFPAAKNFVGPQNNKIYCYKGFWYLMDEKRKFKLTITETEFKRILFKKSYKEREFQGTLNISFSELMTDDKPVIINDIEFYALDNELTKDSKNKLHLEDEVIKKILENK